MQTPLLLDTGAAVTLLRKDTWDKVTSHSPQQLVPWSETKLVGANGSPLNIHGSAPWIECMICEEVHRLTYTVKIVSLRPVPSIVAYTYIKPYANLNLGCPSPIDITR